MIRQIFQRGLIAGMLVMSLTPLVYAAKIHLCRTGSCSPLRRSIPRPIWRPCGQKMVAKSFR